MKIMFSPDNITKKELNYAPAAPIASPAAVIDVTDEEAALSRGQAFSDHAQAHIVSDFEKTQALFDAGRTDAVDRMVHVSTFVFLRGMIYVTYYANCDTPDEDPAHQRARLVYCPEDDTDSKRFLDIQAVGDRCGEGTVELLYDTILMKKDERYLMILWTAKVSGNYYRLYRTFDTVSETLGDIGVNRFTVGAVTNDFSATGIRAALAENVLPCKTMYSDIGIMQKLTWRNENGVRCAYSGAYSGDFNCIIKSRDLITWEYVAQPDFTNLSKWENAVYVKEDKCYYFVRQSEGGYGFLTCYDLNNKTWDKPVLVADCQSRSDFIEYGGELLLFHAPIDREHIGVLRVDRENLAASREILLAHMHSSCFYPFVDYGRDGKLFLSYTVARKHIRLAEIAL